MNSSRDAQPSRRSALQTLAFASCLGLTGGRAFAGESGIRDYLMGLRKSDGGFGWSDQPRSHLVATHAVVGCCMSLKIELTDVDSLARFVRQKHPAERKPIHQRYRDFDLQQIETLYWLGQDTSDFRERVAKWTAPAPYAKQYEKHAYPVFHRQIATLLCREKLQLPWDDLDEPMREYVAQRRRPSGSFRNTPHSDGGEGHVVATWWGLQAARLFGEVDESRAKLIQWLQACQRSDGGFTWQPGASLSAFSTATTTRAALRSLRLLDAQPIDQSAATAFLFSLKNSDGGFAERPGWLSNPLSAYYAVDALEALKIVGEADRPKLQSTPNRNPSLPEPSRRPKI